MGTDVAAALMAKLQLLYGQDDGSFLSFVIPGFAVSPRDLDFRRPVEKSGLTPQERLASAADFARLANLVPAVSSQWTTDGRLLWSEYEAVLRDAQVAQSDRTPAEEAELQKARDLLYQQRTVTDESGTHQVLDDSPKLKAYRTYQTAYLQKKQQYDSLKLSAASSTDPAVVQAWQSAEPLYAADLRAALADWVAKGAREEVEEAFADIERITGRNAQVTWSAWRQLLDQSVLTDLNNGDFHDTGLWPSEFFLPAANAQWTTVNLNGQEAEQLSAQLRATTPGLPAPDGVQAPELAIQELTVEVLRAEFLRTWFNPGVFTSRSWRWPDGRDPLSDGQSTPHGSLTAYAQGVIFARNLEITLQPDAPANQVVQKQLETGRPILLGPLRLEAVPAAGSPDRVVRLRSTPVPLDSPASPASPGSPGTPGRLQPQLRVLLDRRAPQVAAPAAPAGKPVPVVIDHRRLVDAVSPTAVSPAAVTTVGGPLAPRLAPRTEVLAPVTPTMRPVPVTDGPMPTPTLIRNPKLLEQIRRPLPVPNPPTTPPPPQPKDPGGLQIVAFICRRVPSSPKPDPAAKW